MMITLLRSNKRTRTCHLLQEELMRRLPTRSLKKTKSKSFVLPKSITSSLEETLTR